MQTVFAAGRLWDGQRLIDNPLVVVEDGRIASIESRDSAAAPAASAIRDFGNTLLGPSFFDVHIHGSAGRDVMDGTDEAFDTVGSFLASRGTATYLATTVTAPMDKTLRSLEQIARRIDAAPREGQAAPIGIHLEGPFLSHARRGVHPPDLLREPDIATFDRMFEAAQGKVRLMTLAPELPCALELAAHATARGVRISIGHSDATAAQTRAGIAAGAVSATHTYNAMRPLDHREPGILGIVLSDDSLFAELICDGIHNTPEMVKLWWRCKGSERAILITDAMSAAGMPEGTYQLGGFDVQVADGRASANGVLAGSVLTLDRALANFIQFTGASVEQGMRLLSSNPAAMTGFEQHAGTLCPGDAANFVAVDPAGTLVASVIGGRVAS